MRVKKKKDEENRSPLPSAQQNEKRRGSCEQTSLWARNDPTIKYRIIPESEKTEPESLPLFEDESIPLT